MPMNIYETPGIENYVKIHLHYYTKVNQKKKDTFENIITCFLSMNPSNKNVDSFSNS